MNLRLTTAGRAAIADAANVGTAAVRFTHFAIGDGQGPGGAADDGRAALRGERHRAAVTGTAAADGRIAFRADFTPDADYGITEAGVFGTAGDPAGPLTLYAYWTDGGTEAGKAVNGVALVVAAVIEFAQAAGDVAVTVGATITIGANVVEATEDAFGLTRYATDAEAGAGLSGERAVTAKALRAAAGKTVGSLVPGGPVDGTVYQLKGAAGGDVVAEARGQDPATTASLAAITALVSALDGRVTAVEDATDPATTASRGIVELATPAEAQAGTDESRAVTPKALHDSASDLVAGLSAADIEADARYVLEGLAGGGLRLVRSAFLIREEVVTVRTRTYTGDLIGNAFDLWLGQAGAGAAIELAEGDWIVGTWIKGVTPATGPVPVSNHEYTQLGDWIPEITFSAGVQARIGRPVQSNYPWLREGLLGGMRVPAGGVTMTPRLIPLYVTRRISWSRTAPTLSDAEDATLSAWADRVGTLVSLAAPAIAIGT